MHRWLIKRLFTDDSARLTSGPRDRLWQSKILQLLWNIFWICFNSEHSDWFNQEYMQVHDPKHNLWQLHYSTLSMPVTRPCPLPDYIIAAESDRVGATERRPFSSSSVLTSWRDTSYGFDPPSLTGGMLLKIIWWHIQKIYDSSTYSTLSMSVTRPWPLNATAWLHHHCS